MLLLSASALIEKLNPLQKNGEHRFFIIDDTVEAKQGKHIEGSCRYIWSNGEHRTINALNIVSLNYADTNSNSGELGFIYELRLYVKPIIYF